MSKSPHTLYRNHVWWALPYGTGGGFYGPIRIKAGVYSANPRGARHRLTDHAARDKNLFVEPGSIPPCAGVLLWINKEPLLDSNGRLMLDGNGEIVASATHTATNFGFTSWGFYQVGAQAIPQRRK